MQLLILIFIEQMPVKTIAATTYLLCSQFGTVSVNH